MQDISKMVTNIDNISNMLSKQGIVIGILAVVLFLFIMLVVTLIYIVRKILSSNTKMLEQFMERSMENGEAIEKASESVKTIVENSKSKNEDIVGMFHTFNEVFKDFCKRILIDTQAVRASLYVFHNGMVSSHGLPFFKMSCIGEWYITNAGIIPQEHNALPLSMMPEVIDDIYNLGCFSLNLKDSTTSAQYVAFIQTSNQLIERFIIVSLYDDDNKIMGFIRVDFDKNLDEDQINEYTEMIKERVIAINTLLQHNKNNAE